MCVMSMVFDHYAPKFEPFDIYKPLQQVDFTATQKLIDEFGKAQAAAKVVDDLTQQPNCEDPAKATLLERVAELEKRIAALEQTVGK